jgi:hypothetical protein
MSATMLQPFIAIVAALGAASAATGSPSAVRPYYEFVHWMATGRPDLALAQFAEDAVVIAGPQCTAASPCVGHEAIRDRYLADLVRGHAVLPLKVLAFDGHTVHTREGPSVRADFDGQPASWQAGHAITLKGDRIVALRVEWTWGEPIGSPWSPHPAPARVTR